MSIANMYCKALDITDEIIYNNFKYDRLNMSED